MGSKNKAHEGVEAAVQGVGRRARERGPYTGVGVSGVGGTGAVAIGADSTVIGPGRRGVVRRHRRLRVGGVTPTKKQ